jgi:hypothetical protein
MPRSRTSYRHELRSNEKKRFKALLANRISVEGVDISSIEQQFLTDVKNLQNRPRGLVAWLLYRGGSKRLVRDLKEAGIGWHDLEFDLLYQGATLTEDELNSAVTRAWPTEIVKEVEASQYEISD